MIKAINLHLEAWKWTLNSISKGKFLVYFIPGLIASLFFASLYTLTREIETALGFVKYVPLIGEYIYSAVSGTFGLIYFIFLQIYMFTVLTLLSPFNTLLSEAVDTEITSRTYSFSNAQVIKDFLRMIFIVFLALVMEFFFMIAWWIISWIFGLGILDSLMYFLISAFFFGFAFYDYSLERSKKGVIDSLGFSFSKLPVMILSGTGFLLIYYIPFVGVMLAPVLTTIVSSYIYTTQYSEQQ